MIRPIIVALHGVGSSARDMVAALAPLAPHGEVVALDGCEPFDRSPQGRQWFSVSGVTDADRPLRVAGAIPSLLRRLDAVADRHGVARHDLVLAGFSQGAIMVLALMAQGLHPGRAVSIAGRLAAPVKLATDNPASLLLIDDANDAVMPPALSDEAAQSLSTAGYRVARAHTAGLGHSIGPATVTAIADWLASATSLQATSIQGQAA